MKTTTKLVLLSTLSAVSTLLTAPPARAAQAPDGEAPATVVAAPQPEARGTADDPNIDRAFLLPTAMTQPAGSATYNNYELLLHGFTYGVTDRVQATITVVSPITKDVPFIGLVAAKGQIVSTPRFHFAVQGSAGLFQSFTTGSDHASALGGGAFATVCLREDCSSLLSASGTYELILPGGGRTSQLLLYGGSIVHSVSPHVKLLGEITSATAKDSGTNNSFDQAPGVLASYGVRLHGSSFAGDIGFIKPISSGNDGGILLGLPFASVSYRWL
jgi:hypothetical protein